MADKLCFLSTISRLFALRNGFLDQAAHDFITSYHHRQRALQLLNIRDA